MKIKLYNSSDRLVFEGSYEDFEKMKKMHLVNDSDRIVIIK